MSDFRLLTGDSQRLTAFPVRCLRCRNPRAVPPIARINVDRVPNSGRRAAGEIGRIQTDLLGCVASANEFRPIRFHMGRADFASEAPAHREPAEIRSNSGSSHRTQTPTGELGFYRRGRLTQQSARRKRNRRKSLPRLRLTIRPLRTHILTGTPAQGSGSNRGFGL